jgi:hypothetical protein
VLEVDHYTRSCCPDILKYSPKSTISPACDLNYSLIETKSPSKIIASSPSSPTSSPSQKLNSTTAAPSSEKSKKKLLSLHLSQIRKRLLLIQVAQMSLFFQLQEHLFF